MFVSQWRNNGSFLMLKESMEALQGHKDDFPAASAGVGDSGESLCWCDDSKLDFKQFVETISVLYHPYLNSASEGPQQENRFYEAVLYNPTGKPEIFWYIPSIRCLLLGFKITFQLCNSF